MENKMPKKVLERRYLRYKELKSSNKATSTSKKAKGLDAQMNDALQRDINQLANDNTARTFAFNDEQAEKERDWSTWMSNTAHQREVNDLRKSGLNPVLSANSGANAYVGASASGQADTSNVNALANVYMTKLNNDNSVKLTKLQNENNYKIAKLNASLARYASDRSYAASVYGAGANAAATMAAAGAAAAATRYASDNAAAASRYASDNAYKGTQYSTDYSRTGNVEGIASSYFNRFVKYAVGTAGSKYNNGRGEQ